MGSWTLVSTRPDIRDRNDVYGHYFAVKFKLKYSTSLIGSFSEMPRLEWKETITMVEPTKGTWWQFVGDQYERNPSSQTFITWTSRYKNAYHCVRRQLYGNPDELCILYDKHGNRLPPDTFPRGMAQQGEQAELVRNYLKAHGGIMEVTVVDKPGINKPQVGQAVDKHRILTFDCGLRGLGMRVTAYQDLKVSSSVPEDQWKRQCVLGSISTPFSTAGLTKVQPPPDVLIVKAFSGGAHDGLYQ